MTVQCPRCKQSGSLRPYNAILPGKPYAGYVTHGQRVCQLSYEEIRKLEKENERGRTKI